MMEIFSREELSGMSRKQLQNLSKYYGVSTKLKGGELIDALLLTINGPKSDVTIEGQTDVQMSVRVARANGGK